MDEDLDWSRIHRAVDHRQQQLGLSVPDLAARMRVHPRTVTNLRHHTVSAPNLERASRALDWHEDALRRIGYGADPDDLPTKVWEPPEHVGLAQRVERLERELSGLRDDLREIRRSQRDGNHPASRP